MCGLLLLNRSDNVAPNPRAHVNFNLLTDVVPTIIQKSDGTLPFPSDFYPKKCTDFAEYHVRRRNVVFGKNRALLSKTNSDNAINFYF